MNTEFVAYIEAKNLETQVWIDAGPDRWASMLPTDEQYWADRGISTIAQYERDTDECCLYEICKDLGWRRNYSEIKALTDAELTAEVEFHSKQLSIQIEQDRRAELVKVEQFETRVTETIAMGAGDRVTALKWILEAEDCHEDFAFYGYESLEYRLGIPFGYIKGSL